VLVAHRLLGVAALGWVLLASCGDGSGQPERVQVPFKTSVTFSPISASACGGHAPCANIAIVVTNAGNVVADAECRVQLMDRSRASLKRSEC
jgi:hypothetical protein